MLQGGDVVALCFLAAVEREGEAVDVGLADDEALAGLLVGQVGQVEGAGGTLDEGLLEVEVADGHDDFFFDADFLLAGGDADDVEVVSGHVVLAFAHAPVDQGDGEGDGDHVLLEGVAVGAAQVFGHLVEADAGVDAGVEAGLLAGTVDFLLGFEDILTELEEVGVVLTGHGQGFVDGDGEASRRAGQDEAQAGVFGQVEEGGEGEHGASEAAGGRLEGVGGIDVVQLEGEQVSSADGGYLEAFAADVVEGVRAGQLVGCQVVFGLCHGQLEEVGGGLLADLLGVVEVLLLDFLVLQGLDAPFPAEGVVAYEVLRVAHLKGDAGVLRIAVGAEVAHVSQRGVGVERAAGQVEVLAEGEVTVGVERLLGAVDVDVGLRVITAGDVTVILRGGQVERQTGQAVGTIGAVLPVSAEIHVLRTKGFERAVVGQADGLPQVKRQAGLCQEGRRGGQQGE